MAKGRMTWHVSRYRHSEVVYGGNQLLFLGLTLMTIIGKLFSFYLLFVLSGILLLADLFIVITLLILFFVSSYVVREDSIIFYYHFKRKKIKIEDIKSIVVTNNIQRGQFTVVEKVKNHEEKIVPCPMLVLIDQDASLSGTTLEHPMKNWDIKNILEKNNKEANVLILFMANPKIFSSFEKHFKGKLYIARTVYENFKVEISEIYSRWKYDGKAINIIQDRNAKKDWCNSPYLDLAE